MQRSGASSPHCRLELAPRERNWVKLAADEQRVLQCPIVMKGTAAAVGECQTDGGTGVGGGGAGNTTGVIGTIPPVTLPELLSVTAVTAPAEQEPVPVLGVESVPPILADPLRLMLPLVATFPPVACTVVP